MPDRRDKGKSFIFFLNIVLIIPLSSVLVGWYGVFLAFGVVFWGSFFLFACIFCIF